MHIQNLVWKLNFSIDIKFEDDIQDHIGFTFLNMYTYYHSLFIQNFMTEKLNVIMYTIYLHYFT